MNKKEVEENIRIKFAGLNALGGIDGLYKINLSFHKLFSADKIDGQKLSLEERAKLVLSGKVVYSNDKINNEDLREADFIESELLICENLMQSIKSDPGLTKRSDLKIKLENYINYLNNKLHERPSGLYSWLNDNQKRHLYNALCKLKYIIAGNPESFIAALTPEPLPMDFQPLQWDESISKLRALFEFAADKEVEKQPEIQRNQQYFIDNKKEYIVIGNPPGNKDYIRRHKVKYKNILKS